MFSVVMTLQAIMLAKVDPVMSAAVILPASFPRRQMCAGPAGFILSSAGFGKSGPFVRVIDAADGLQRHERFIRIGDRDVRILMIWLVSGFSIVRRPSAELRLFSHGTTL